MPPSPRVSLMRICTRSPCTQLAIVLAIGALAASCSWVDPWWGCPEDRQCLSGDILTNEAKSCCGEEQVCYNDAPREGGSGISEEKAARRDARRRKVLAPAEDAPDGVEAD